jgi:hypothetical protein
MNVLTDTWRGLVERRLWPVALLLLGAALALPVVLGKRAEEAPPATPVAAEAAGDDPSQSIVTLAAAEQREAGRDVVGVRKDPFRPHKPATGDGSLPDDGASGGGGGGGGAAAATGGGGWLDSIGALDSLDSGGAAGGSIPAGGGDTGVSPGADGGGDTGASPGADGGGDPSAPGAPRRPSAPKKVYEVATISVRFGSADGSDLKRMNVRRLTALPDVVDPALVYLGLKRDNKTAVFLVDEAATIDGDGRCLPSPQECETVMLSVGDTLFVEYDAGSESKQYRLDFRKVLRKQTLRASSSSRSELGNWRYDDKTGHVTRVKVEREDSEPEPGQD